MTVIIRPIITEKSLQLAQKGWYTFQVAKQSHKVHVARAVNELYKVKVLDVRSITVPGKEMKTGRKRTVRKTSAWKKALVKLAKEQTIAVFSTGEKK
ncbi:TPA: 50S ribosomal protein L23 [Patescibacteria group bacterium]|uniref:Large ribosomal subunit protein uL23 n=1 Tax=Candidatus Gottesmanbacteria bacterium GW2011_GWA1_43_11 TaxID=1618436 RepID=A0A0G1CGJ3_9BACT|nr:MAG: 50S ribosomal protein L23 [Candidatus Gottesmanbacteria bacterium GW2011_GWA1_43_11]HCS78454.1 50S ribosomal protein L23 [Patescibacteria group bacterium]